MNKVIENSYYTFQEYKSWKRLGFNFVFTWPAGLPQQHGAPITEGP